MMIYGEVLQRVWPCVTSSAQPRSDGHLTNFQLFTFPRGIPGEDSTEPRGPMPIRLGALRRTSIIPAEQR